MSGSFKDKTGWEAVKEKFRWEGGEGDSWLNRGALFLFLRGVFRQFSAKVSMTFGCTLAPPTCGRVSKSVTLQRAVSLFKSVGQKQRKPMQVNKRQIPRTVHHPVFDEVVDEVVEVHVGSLLKSFV